MRRVEIEWTDVVAMTGKVDVVVRFVVDFLGGERMVLVAEGMALVSRKVENLT
jgi:hypothetical protein